MPGVFGKDESVFNILDAESHKKYRKLIARPYSFSNIKKIEPSIDAIISKWTTQLETRFTTTQPGHRIEFDFAPWAVYMAYDAISEIGFGSPFGFIDQGKDVAGLIQGFHDGMPYFGAMARLWPFTMWIKDTFLGKFLVASPEHESGVGVLMRFRDRIIEDQIRENSSGITTKKSSLLQASVLILSSTSVFEYITNTFPVLWTPRTRRGNLLTSTTLKLKPSLFLVVALIPPGRPFKPSSYIFSPIKPFMRR